MKTQDYRHFPKAVWGFVRAEFVLVASLAVIAAAVLFFIGIADEMSEGEAHGFDMAVLQMLHSDAANPSDPIGPKWLDHAAADLTAIGSVSVLAVLALLVGSFLVLQHKRLEAAIIAVAFGGGLTISQLLKEFFNRERPPEIYRASEILNASFPSGHALLSTVVFLTLGAMLVQAAKGQGLRIFVMSAAIALAVLVGVTRIYLGVHWTTDVLAGWAAGAAWATACWLAGRWLKQRGVARQTVPDKGAGAVS
ncbi:MAG TPA: phosphatase PAP2 family protein [Hyphomonadaceae bacterium]|nr:phosphatase PAP2 family protein [Hyphomonadaceae bacterium]HPN05624.1 phosphatase PAP2 family protein [Hyphomonadaceae bacterium]